MRFLIILFIIYINAFSDENKDFIKWKNEFKKILIQEHGYKQTLMNEIFKNTKLISSIIKKDKNQLHKKISLSDYLKRVVSKDRINKGKKEFKKHKNLLKKIENIYGVDARIITALWGIESFYGKRQGKYIVSDAMLTLIYDGRRSKFFTKEFLNIVSIIESQNINKNQVKGSWAGAMGACQFMPTSYNSYAVDGDGDGVKNIWTNNTDIFHSIANYLKKNRYRAKEPIAIEITSKKQKKLIAKFNNKKMSIKEWNKKGLKIDTKDTYKATLKKIEQRYFLVFYNFKVLKRWNKSDPFALSAVFLANEFI